MTTERKRLNQKRYRIKLVREAAARRAEFLAAISRRAKARA